MEQVLITTDLTETYSDAVTPLQVANATAGLCPDNAFEISKIIIDFLLRYVSPFLLVFGSLGNILSFVVFSRPSICNSAPAFYFRVLAVADTLALNVGLWPKWLKDAFGIRLYSYTDVTCRIETYLKYVLPDFAVWILVIMTIERLVAVCRPHLVRRIFTRAVIRGSLLTMILAVCIINVPSIYINTHNNTSCQPYPENEQLAYKIWPWIDLSMYFLLPAAIIITCNSVIIYTIVQRQRTMSRRTSTDSDAGYTMAAMTIILLTVTVVFVLLTAPFVLYSCSVIHFYAESRIDWCLFFYMASLLRYVNNSVNFLLYCMSGRAFRAELKQLCRKTTDPKYRVVRAILPRFSVGSQNSVIWSTLVNQLGLLCGYNAAYFCSHPPKWHPIAGPLGSLSLVQTMICFLRQSF